jgi:hypothetical protein
MGIPPPVRELVGTYLAAVDDAAPGLVAGLYLVGSVALDDFRPGASDVDFVAVTANRLSGADRTAVERAHATVAARHPRPYLDGSYVTWADLAGDPAAAAPGLNVHEGRPGPPGAGDPVTWHTLASHGVVLRGQTPDALDVWTDDEALRDWCRQNLVDYWQPWLGRARRLFSRLGAAGLTGWGPAWGVLGVSRIHYTIVTGAITSKLGAGQYARNVFAARWQRIIDECLRLRRQDRGGGRYLTPLARRRDTLDFMAMAIDDAQRLG